MRTENDPDLVPRGLRTEHLVIGHGRVSILVEPVARSARCLSCNLPSRRMHTAATSGPSRTCPRTGSLDPQGPHPPLLLRRGLVREEKLLREAAGGGCRQYPQDVSPGGSAFGDRPATWWQGGGTTGRRARSARRTRRPALWGQTRRPGRRGASEGPRHRRFRLASRGPLPRPQRSCETLRCSGSSTTGPGPTRNTTVTRSWSTSTLFTSARLSLGACPIPDRRGWRSPTRQSPRVDRSAAVGRSGAPRSLWPPATAPPARGSFP